MHFRNRSIDWINKFFIKKEPCRQDIASVVGAGLGVGAVSTAAASGTHAVARGPAEGQLVRSPATPDARLDGLDSVHDVGQNDTGRHRRHSHIRHGFLPPLLGYTDTDMQAPTWRLRSLLNVQITFQYSRL